MRGSNIPVDIDRRRRFAGAPREFYQRPKMYYIDLPLFTANGNRPTCLARGNTVQTSGAGGRTPAVTLLVQADFNNAGYVTIGDAQCTLLNGIQMDPGKSIMFSTVSQNVGESGWGLKPTPLDIERAIEYMEQLQRSTIPYDPPRILLDVADFYAASDVAGQRIRVFHSIFTRA